MIQYQKKLVCLWYCFFVGWLLAPIVAPAQNLIMDYLRYGFGDRGNDPPQLLFPLPTNRALEKPSRDFPTRPSLRGNVEIYFIESRKSVNITIIRQDINISVGPDPFAFTVYNSWDEPIFLQSFGDDGNETASLVPSAVMENSFTVNLPEPGIYRIQTNVSRDLRYDVIVDAAYSALHSTLEYLDSSQSLDLYFPAPANELEITFSTLHYAGINQTIDLFDDSEQPVASIFLGEINKLFSLRASVPTAEIGKLWHLHIVAQDLSMRSLQVPFWYLSRDQYYDFAFAEELLKPRILEMAGIPGATIPLRYQIHNTKPTGITLSVEWMRADGDPAMIPPQSARFTVKGSTTVFQYFPLHVSPNSISGSSTTFVVRLQDASGTLLAQSRAILDVTHPVDSPSPSQPLLVSQSHLELIRRAGTSGSETYKNIASNLLQEADQIVAEHLLVPESEAGWNGSYVCDGIGDGNDDPNDGDGAPLIFNPNQPGVYICSIDGRRYHGERYRLGWLGYYHYEICERLRILGFAYALEPRTQYATLVREMLLAYADRYNSWPLDDYQGLPSIRAARLMTETLGEAAWITYALIGYDFTRNDPIYTSEDRAHIELNLILPAMQVIQRNPMGTSNWQAWHNTALGLGGFVLNHAGILDTALHGPNGLDFLKTQAIREDGLWVEGSVGYHFYALSALNYLLEALEAHGIPAFDDRMRLAYASVLDILLPDGSFPKLNDSGEMKISSLPSHFEVAHTHYDDPRFDQILSFLYDHLGYLRNAPAALFFGKDYQTTSLSLQSDLKKKMGLAVLRSGNLLPDETAMVDYGPQGMTHGHYDKLHLTFYGQGDIWLPDLGIGDVSSPEHPAWFRHTLGHNTILLGEQSQQADTEAERPIRFYTSLFPSVQIMQAEFGPPVYPVGSQVRRTVLEVNGEYALTIDDVRGGPSPYDFVFHSAGDFFSADAFVPRPDDPVWNNSYSSYRFLKPPRLFNQASAAAILHHTGKSEIRVECRKAYGLQDDFENVDDWTGNVNLSTDATQGRNSLVWIIVPQEYQSIQKEYFLLDVNHTIPDRLTFDYKIDSTVFSHLSLRLIDVPSFRNSQWEITRGSMVESGKWQQADIDLTQPDYTYGSNLLARRVQLVLTGAENSESAFRVYLDHLQAYRNGRLLEPEMRGLQFLFPTAEETEIVLADGPSAAPPRVHPVILARRTGISQTQMISVLEPYLSYPKIQHAENLTKNEVTIKGENHTDRIQFDTENNQYTFFRTDSSSVFSNFTQILSTQFITDYFAYQSDKVSDFCIKRSGETRYSLVFQYHKPATVNDLLKIRIPDPIYELKIDQQNRMTYRLERQSGGYILYLENLPVGKHELTLYFAMSTSIGDWLRLDVSP